MLIQNSYVSKQLTTSSWPTNSWKACIQETLFVCNERNCIQCLTQRFSHEPTIPSVRIAMPT